MDWDVTFVDDGSRDASVEVIRQLHAQAPDRVRLVAFRRNYGQTSAISAGITKSDGDVVILMDADLQMTRQTFRCCSKSWTRASTWLAVGAKIARTTS